MSYLLCRILAGAPTYDDPDALVAKTGAVFKCPLSTYIDDCQDMNLDITGNYNNLVYSKQLLCMFNFNVFFSNFNIFVEVTVVFLLFVHVHAHFGLLVAMFAFLINQ